MPKRPFSPAPATSAALIDTLEPRRLLAAVASTVATDLTYGPDGTIADGAAIFELERVSTVRAITSTGDGDVVVAIRDIGSLGNNLLRLDPAGLPDPSFGDNGIVVLDNDRMGGVRDLHSLPNGKIIALGGFYGSPPYLSMTRLLPDGSIDPTFGNAGYVEPQQLAAGGILPRSDGSLLIWGEDPWDDDVARLTLYSADGQLDTSFGYNGHITIYPGTTLPGVRSPFFVGADIDSQDRVLLHYGQDTLRFLPDMTIDTSFDGEGRLELDKWLRYMRVTADDRILFSDYAAPLADNGVYRNESDIYLQMRQADGQIDTGFGNGGERYVDIDQEDSFHAIIDDGDGFLIAAGDSFGVARVTADGNLDRSFGIDGRHIDPLRIYQTPFQIRDRVGGGVVLPNGDIVIVGITPKQPGGNNSTDRNENFMARRYVRDFDAVDFDIAASALAVDEGAAVTLDASDTTVAGGSITEFAWDFNHRQLSQGPDHNLYPNNYYLAFDLEATGAQAAARPLDNPGSRMLLGVDTSTGYRTFGYLDLTVTNQNPVITLDAPPALAKGQARAFNWDITDAGILDTLTVTVDWGDGTDPFVTDRGRYGQAHAYAELGNYTVTITAVDNDGGTATLRHNVIVEQLLVAFRQDTKDFLLPRLPTSAADQISAFLDLDSDGVLSSGDIEGVNVGDGDLIFANVPPGQVTMIPSLPAGWNLSRHWERVPLNIPADDGYDVDIRTTNDIVLGGYVWNDANRNGVWDQNEVPVGGQTVWIDVDEDGDQNTFGGGGDRSAVTRDDGSYVIYDYVRTHHVRTTDRTARLIRKFGVEQTFPAGSLGHVAPATDTDGTDDNRIRADFGIASGGAAISIEYRDANDERISSSQVFGFFADLNRNGQFDALEPVSEAPHFGRFDSGEFDLLPLPKSGFVPLGDPLSVVLEDFVDQSLVMYLENVAPTLRGGDYPLDLGPRSIFLEFSEPLNGLPQNAAVSVVNLTTGQPISASVIQVSTLGDRDERRAIAVRFVDPNSLPVDGNYRLTLDTTGLTDRYGLPFDGDITFDYFYLAGDANRDRVVDLADFVILRNNFGTGRSFVQADFNDDNTVDLADFVILRNQFGKSLPAPGDDDEREWLF